MPRSSRHKSHRQSKHSSRDAREQSNSEDDMKINDKKGKEEALVRVSRDLGSSEKRKLSLSKDSSGHVNGGTSEEYVASKRRKEKADVSAASDRWNVRGDEIGDGATVGKDIKKESSEVEADKKSKSTSLVDSKSKSSRRHGSGGEKKEENADLGAEKEDSKSGGRVDSKRKSEKDSGRKEVLQYKDSSESKDKERGFERERRIQEIKGETEAPAVTNDASRKQGLHSVYLGEEQQGKIHSEYTDIQHQLPNPELEKELEKHIGRTKDSSNDKDKYQEVKERKDRRLSSKAERAKDGRYKDEKHKDGSYGDKHREDGGRDKRNRDDKYRDDAETDSKQRDVKYREDGDRDNRHKDDKYQEDGDLHDRHRGNKYHESGDRDNRHKDDKYHEDEYRNDRHRDNKYRGAADRDNRPKDDKYREDGYRDNQHMADKSREDGHRDGKHKDDWYLEDGHRDNRNREERNCEDVGRDGRHWDRKQIDDGGKDKRLRDAKHRDERSSRDLTSDKSDIKRLRDESKSAELHYRKANNRDGSPFYDDHSTRYKDDGGRKRTSDNEDHGDIRPRSTKEQHSGVAKKSKSSARVESVSDRGRPNSHNADVEITPNHSRRRSSPSSSSHAAKDLYRPSKPEEPKYREYVYEERVRHNMTFSKEFAGVSGVTEKASLSWSIEKSLQKDDSHLGELSAERRAKPEARASPLQVMDNLPSSMSSDRRYMNRSDVRRSLDIDESGQRSGGLKETKVYSGKEGRGSRELAMEALPGDELSQADGDHLSASSPFSRTSHLSSSSRSLLPPPHPFRIGADNHIVLGSLEDDNRDKASNRNRRNGDPNMGRVQGSAWRGVPTWPSPVPNGFIPFQHGPPPVGFHPMLHQFPAPPLFNVRPSMELNQSGIPYHIPDGNRFSGQGRPLGWRNPVDDSGRPIHRWDPNNSVFGDESHIYRRLDWDHNRTDLWEKSGDAWKGQNSGASLGQTSSAPQREDYSVRGPTDEVWTDQSGLLAQNDKNQPIVLAERSDIDPSSDAHERSTLEDPKTISEEVPNLSRKDDACLSHVYLSMLDISAELAQPELYSQFTSLMCMDQNSNSEEDDSKFLFVEETIDAKKKTPNKTSSASLFSPINDSIFQKAVSLYKKLRKEVGAINGEKIPFCNADIHVSAPPFDQEGAGSNDDKPGEVILACDEQAAAGVVSASNILEMEASPAITCEKIDEPVTDDIMEISRESIAALNKVKMELDSVSKQEALDYVVEAKPSYVENLGHLAINNEGQKLPNAKCDHPLLVSDVSSEVYETVRSESDGSGSVNLSRIHQSPKSTH
ncbi:hypothetical protein U1Q18_021117 [Sarracenia purpurea var. burkii]